MKIMINNFIFSTFIGGSKKFGLKKNTFPVCHSCGEKIIDGLLYECSICPDYLLCRSCRVDRNHKKIHMGHNFRTVLRRGNALMCSFLMD